MKEFIWLLLIPIFMGVIAGLLKPNKKRRRKNRNASTNKKSSNTSVNANRRTSKSCRTDDIILTNSFSDINGVEFERLLALYFRDQGYTVHEVGIGGNDGGVDLVIIDKRGEKTAVQAKCYADHNLIPVQTIRELVAAKRNHDCILTLLITTSDLTGPAKKEAEQFRVEYWHGGIIEQKLRAWGKWRPSSKSKAK
ncbi:restriction endonuclease [Cohnella lupini]|uniref:Restriction system protein n=1 Tax=Cohnella lupini TaxID=1294267 RepID=A0A3D9IA15_9BACL|nr:restriction endonuclease [Cohnella lupini]RED58510.1 restriction system protein [Cohnella lupini]